jgi:hypothetical protein
MGGLIMSQCGCNAVSPITDVCNDGVLGAFAGCDKGFLLLLLLFILLACSQGREQTFFFIIILAIIAFGGFGRTFGFGI